MRRTVLVAIFLALFCGTAAAQREGQYQGSLANGTTLTITVDHNPANSRLRIAAATLSFQTPCASLGTGGGTLSQVYSFTSHNISYTNS